MNVVAIKPWFLIQCCFQSVDKTFFPMNESTCSSLTLGSCKLRLITSHQSIIPATYPFSCLHLTEAQSACLWTVGVPGEITHTNSTQKGTGWNWDSNQEPLFREHKQRRSQRQPCMVLFFGDPDQVNWPTGEKVTSPPGGSLQVIDNQVTIHEGDLIWTKYQTDTITKLQLLITSQLPACESHCVSGGKGDSWHKYL